MALVFDLKSCLDFGLWETTLLAFKAEPGRRTAVASFREATPTHTTHLELRPIGRVTAHSQRSPAWPSPIAPDHESTTHTSSVWSQCAA